MKKNKPILMAGIIMSITSFLHLIGGGEDHVVPLLDSELNATDKAVLLGVWHMVTVVLFLMAFWILRYALKPLAERIDGMYFLAWLNMLFALVFIGVSIFRWTFTPQWTLFLPIGLLILYGLKHSTKNAEVAL